MVRELWWWNGRCGQLVRLDVMVHRRGDRWLVETRLGGDEGRSREFPADTRQDAQHIAEQFMRSGGTWRAMHE